ncbi:type II toxin-antitoxin system ParD family antitoxin [Pseudonocardia sp. TMWB2A]|uniref:type II toxin-antitoxin system ParD family antitoxin n=1 Tax=Pseudonocardia sp. TMWB2A TaxID=687430 RepID=UPI00307F9D90
MNLSIGERWEDYIDQLLQQGRYGSASEIVREGLRLVEEREQKLAALRARIEASIAEGGAHSIEDMRGSVKATLGEWEKKRKQHAA